MSINIKTYTVPVNVQALRIGYSDTTQGQFKWPEFNFPSSSTKEIALGPDVMQPLIGTANGVNTVIGDNSDGRDAGIRLHWALPDAVVRGSIGKDRTKPHDLQFPKIPNRWLVTAYYYNKKSKSNTLKQWIVESDAVQDGPSAAYPKIAIPDATVKEVNLQLPLKLRHEGKAPKFNSKYLGRIADDISAWKEPGETNALDALSYFGPTFTAYYMNGATVCGFYDNLQHLGDASSLDIEASYQVVGWYSDIKHDIASIAFVEAQKAYAKTDKSEKEAAFIPAYIKKELKWQFIADQTNPPYSFNSIPDDCRSIFNGMMISLNYKAKTTYLSDKDAPTSLQLAIGNNIPEAVSSLLVNNSDIGKDAPSQPNPKNPYPDLESKKDLEYLLNAFQQDILRQLGADNSSHRIEQVESMLHRSRFGSYPGGTTWLVRAKSALNSSSPSSQATEVALPLTATKALHSLNRYQDLYDASIRKIETTRQQLFMDWVNNAYVYNNNNNQDISDKRADFWTAQINSWFLLQADTGLVSVKHESETPQSGSSTNAKYSLAFTPQMTVPNTAIDQALFGAGTVIDKLLNGKASSCTSIGLTELQIILGVLVPTCLQKIKEILNQIAQSDKGVAGVLTPTVIKDLNYQAGILKQVYTLLTSNLIHQQSTSLSTQLGTQQEALKKLNSTLKGYTTKLQTEGGAASFYYTDLSVKGGLLEGYTADKYPIKPILSQAKYSGIYDIQSAIVGLEYFGTDTSEYLSGINGGYGAIVESWKRAEQASDAVKNGNATLKALGAQNHLIPLCTFLQTLSTDISTLESKKTVAALQAALAAVQLPDGISTTLEKLDTQLVNVSTCLLDSLPLGHRVVSAANTMNIVTTALQQSVILQQKKAPPFHFPNEPVVAISDKNTPGSTSPLRKINRNGAGTLLPCREATKFVTALQVGKQSITAPSFTLPKIFPKEDTGTTIAKLLQEGYLLAPENSKETGNIKGMLKRYAKQQEQQATPPVWSNKKFPGGNKPVKIAFTGTLPYYIGLNVAEQKDPFLPLSLAWSVNYNGVAQQKNTTKSNLSFDPATISSADGASNFTFDGSDLQPNRVIKRAKDSIIYTGQMLLSDSGNISLVNQLLNFFQQRWGIDLKTVSPAKIRKFTTLQKELYDTYLFFKNDVVLAQGLTGFNAAILERIQNYRFPFNINSESASTLGSGTKLLSTFTKMWDQGRPDWQSYNPINSPQQNIIEGSRFSPLRAGVLTLNQLVLVDVFGRYIKLYDEGTATDGDINIAKSLQMPANGNMGKSKLNSLYLAPRFTQPTRLRFLWEAAEGDKQQAFSEYNSHPAYSPVTGWLITNHLDDNLMVYNKTGQSIGYFETPYTEDKLVWRSNPQSNGGGDNSFSKDSKAANPLLKKFLTDFVTQLTGGNNGTAATFKAAIQQSTQYLGKASLKENAALALLKGRPLALAKARLQLEFYGDAPVAVNGNSLSNSNPAFTGTAPPDDLSQDVNKFFKLPIAKNPANVPAKYPVYDQVARNTAGVESIDIPVMLGNNSYLNDGLIGYFIEEDFNTLYLASDITPVSANGIALKKASPILLNKQNKSSLSVTLLMDPRVSVHASCGMLPEQSIKVPADEYTKAVESLKVYFDVQPVLLGSQFDPSGTSRINYAFPLPQETNYHWSWVQPSLTEDQPLQPNSDNDKAKWASYPVEVQDGWLQLEENKS